MKIEPELLRPDRIVEMLEKWREETAEAESDDAYSGFPHLGTGEHACREMFKLLLRMEICLFGKHTWERMGGK